MGVDRFSRDGEPSFVPTEYFRIAPTKLDLIGPHAAEVLNYEGGPSLPFANNSQGKLSREGQGDVVVESISQGGYKEIARILDSLGANATMRDMKVALTESEIITWDNPSTGR